ncbi:PhzF family phenazine biosynthesis isomerase [Crenobacter caeni]|uniref:PhzF family phenazine biosynthesis protein n=1 Tax=Crenobacter caeni TaxID=2705474 RepID=A0A6B2KPT4_9NEIS|nr:PhzF family phenazine biosynthesis protein [Crenobacter caeni]
MAALPYCIVNVFSDGSRFGGNPLAVFTDARKLRDDEMQAIARQFNLAETVFVLPGEADGTAARLRIFTPATELPFAGHPVLGAAAVLAAQRALGPAFTLRCNAGPIGVYEADGHWFLWVPTATLRPAALSASDAAAMLGLAEGAVCGAPQWVNTGSEQLLIRVSSRDAVRAARPDLARLIAGATLRPGRSIAYLWHAAEGVATVRYFYVQDGAVLEDIGTGSACANLGGYLALGGERDLDWCVEQGETAGRPNRLRLCIDATGQVSVGGRVRAMADGDFRG